MEGIIGNMSIQGKCLSAFVFFLLFASSGAAQNACQVAIENYLGVFVSALEVESPREHLGIPEKFRSLHAQEAFLLRTEESTNLGYLQNVVRIGKEKTFPQRNIRTPEKDPGAERFWVDADYAAHNLLRRQIHELYREDVFRIHQSPTYRKKVREAGQELLDTIFKEFPEKYPQIFELREGKLYNKQSREYWSRETGDHPLEVVGRIVTEDIVLLSRSPDGHYYVIGGFVAQPSRWDLARHMGSSVEKIHDEWAGVKIGMMVERMIDGMAKKNEEREGPPESITRNNWFVEGWGTQAQPDFIRLGRHQPEGRVNYRNAGEKLFFRSEYETISQLPESGVFMFSLKTLVYSIENATKVPSFTEQLYVGLKNAKEAGEEIYYIGSLMRYLEQVMVERQIDAQEYPAGIKVKLK